MTRSFGKLKKRDGLGGWKAAQETMTMNGRRTEMAMCTTATKRLISDAAVRASNDRYRRYHEAKRKIPLDLPPKEYEAAVKKLAKKYRI